MPTSLARTHVAARPCVAFLSTGPQPTDVDVESSLIPRLNAKEVAAVFTAPLYRFVRMGDDASRAKDGIRHEASWINIEGGRWRAHRFFVPRKDAPAGDEKEFMVWGMTARILVDVARLAYGIAPDFEHVEQMGEEILMERMMQAGKMKEKKTSMDTKL